MFGGRRCPIASGNCATFMMKSVNVSVRDNVVADMNYSMIFEVLVLTLARVWKHDWKLACVHNSKACPAPLLAPKHYT